MQCVAHAHAGALREDGIDAGRMLARMQGACAHTIASRLTGGAGEPRLLPMTVTGRLAEQSAMLLAKPGAGGGGGMSLILNTLASFERGDPATIPVMVPPRSLCGRGELGLFHVQSSDGLAERRPDSGGTNEMLRNARKIRLHLSSQLRVARGSISRSSCPRAKWVR